MGCRLGHLLQGILLHQPHSAALSTGAVPCTWSSAVPPRYLEIIYEINRRFLEDMVEAKWPGTMPSRPSCPSSKAGSARKASHGKPVIGSHKVNGVAEIHSKLVKEDLFPQFAELWPEKMCNVTNGVTPRCWSPAP